MTDVHMVIVSQSVGTELTVSVRVALTSDTAGTLACGTCTEIALKPIANTLLSCFYFL